EQNRTFAGKLSDVIEVGIGNLVDADLAKESANLQALQVKQQLGIQALSIANQSPQSILSLFQ
ncbi:MAG: flagellin, partial [Sphingomonadales bacterium]|nr:flagellin [Sphingomonadales bacterium]